MSEIQPLRGVRYNPEKIADLSAVICPPYDVISPAGQRALYQRSPYNFVRIEYGETLPQDSEADNKYLRAAAYLKNWLAEGVFIEEATPAIYVHEHYFTYQGQEHRRRAIACRIRLEEWARMVVRPHEGTLSAPKGDRIRLLSVLGANTSPVFSMYQDKSGEVASVLTRAASGCPVASVPPLEGERHELFAITDPADIAQLQSLFTDKPLYIADGHHRYESALTYQREHHALNPDAPADAPFNFVLMTLADMDDPGLLILPPHRLLRGLTPAKLAELEAKLPSFFDIEKISLEAPNVWQRVEELQNAPDKLRLVMVGLGQSQVWVLTLRDFEAAARLMPYFHTDIYKKLDVSLVDHIVLEEMLGLTPEGEAGIDFNYDRADTVSKVLNGDFQIAFIVKPVRPETIKGIADAQDRMPRKSTYFYPKLPSGLLINRVGKPAV
jgi:uncharacterized protein (DUF1015 family)